MDKLNEIIQEVYSSHREKLEQLTKEEFTKVFIQAIECGDFMMHVQYDSTTMDYESIVGNIEGGIAISYVPYRRVVELERKLREIEEMAKGITGG